MKMTPIYKWTWAINTRNTYDCFCSWMESFPQFHKLSSNFKTILETENLSKVEIFFFLILLRVKPISHLSYPALMEKNRGYRTSLSIQDEQNNSSSYNYRITNCLRLEGTPGHHLVQSPCSSHLEPGAQDHVQTAFEDLQGHRLHNLFGQPAPVRSHHHCKKVFLDRQLIFHSFSVKIVYLLQCFLIA